MSDREIVDRVVYLASLVSDKQSIDPLLDTLRGATAELSDTNSTLSEKSRTELLDLQTTLINHLTTKEPLRSFTSESLHQKLESHFKHENPAAHARRVTLGMIGVIFLISLAAYGIGVAIVPGELSTRFSLAVSLFMTMLNLGIAWLFWSARHELAASAQRATGALAVGLLFSAIASGQYPIFSAFPDLGQMPAFLYGGILLPFACMYALFYTWFYLYAKQVPGVRIGIIAPWPVAGVTIGLGITSVLLPHTPAPNELWFDLSFAAIVMCIFLSAVAALLGFRTISHVTKRYRAALVCFAWAMVVYTLTSFVIAVLIFTNGQFLPADPRATSTATPYTIALILLIFSGYFFKRNIQE